MTQLATRYVFNAQANIASQVQPTPERLSIQTYANDVNSLGFLLQALSQSRRWVYSFCHDFKIRTSNQNIMQVKYAQDSPVVVWIEKVISAQQCSAILLERCPQIDIDMKKVRALCELAGITLIVIDPRQ
ncbi:hypothetical protein [Alteromonas sp. a30]|uniref:hypothetical protein n=1 Tax=Alteromonas sp. a30 TaxID=2730917 RepID=UPI0022832310|nr:hypothetical protein [Alteromonas sp. a30]MCY7294139.1 hypothetical protein [Alteromonas sp. a30]